MKERRLETKPLKILKIPLVVATVSGYQEYSVLFSKTLSALKRDVVMGFPLRRWPSDKMMFANNELQEGAFSTGSNMQKKPYESMMGENGPAIFFSQIIPVLHAVLLLITRNRSGKL